MEKLKKDFRKANLAQGKLNQVNDDLTVFEELYKDNDILKAYKELLGKKQNYEEELKLAKTYLYEDMLEEDETEMIGTNITVTLKKPYEKKSIDTDKFFEDNMPGSRLYKKYVKITTVKGNVNIKQNTDKIKKVKEASRKAKVK